MATVRRAASTAATFKNLPNVGQVALPADPWFNVWVLNQSNATVDQYNLELTLREDTNGDGWTNGLEDSIGLDTTFTSTAFDDKWTILSAPLSSFIDRGTGGNGVFDGDLDEIVIVLGGVQGGVGSTIEVDFDHFTFTSGAPAVFAEAVFDDMDHGNPFGNGWFAFNGSVGGGGIGPNSADLPPALGGGFSLETGWGSGGTPGFYGGFGRTSPTDLSGTEYFNFWINPNAGQDYTLEINLQEDDNSDGAANAGDDDEFQYNCVIVRRRSLRRRRRRMAARVDPARRLLRRQLVLHRRQRRARPDARIPRRQRRADQCRRRGDRWRLRRELPDRLLGVQPRADRPRRRRQHRRLRERRRARHAVRPGCTTARLLHVQRRRQRCRPLQPGDTAGTALPAVGTPNSVLQMDVDVTSFAGFIHGFESAGNWVSQDWSTSEGISLWMHGTDSGTNLFIDILDNRNPGSTTDDAERFTRCVRRRLHRLATARVPVRVVHSQGNRQRRTERRARPVRDARLRHRHTGNRRTADVLLRRGRASTASPRRRHWRSTSRPRTRSSTRARLATSR